MQGRLNTMTDDETRNIERGREMQRRLDYEQGVYATIGWIFGGGFVLLLVYTIVKAIFAQ